MTKRKNSTGSFTDAYPDFADFYFDNLVAKLDKVTPSAPVLAKVEIEKPGLEIHTRVKVRRRRSKAHVPASVRRIKVAKVSRSER